MHTKILRTLHTGRASRTVRNPQTIFMNYYSPRFLMCQQFTIFSHLRNIIFGAMHTIINSFLYILSTHKIAINQHLLTKREQISTMNKSSKHSSAAQ